MIIIIETESLLIAVQNNNIKTHYIKVKIHITQKIASLCYVETDMRELIT